jgi:aryl-alcohol dehydrogenase-like predicted oxidoreductase
VLAQGENIIMIPGSKRLKHLEENIASERVHLTRKIWKGIEAIMPAGIVSETR